MHTPEFSFEHDVSNVRAQAANLGVRYPVAIDDNYATWNAETYVGYQHLQYLVPDNQVTMDAPAVYHFPTPLPLGGLGLSGAWTEHPEEATAGAGGQLELGFQARDVYLVLGGTGTLDVSVNGAPAQTVNVGGVPKLYTLLQGASIKTGVMLLGASPGVEVYDFTFG